MINLQLVAKWVARCWVQALLALTIAVCVLGCGRNLQDPAGVITRVKLGESATDVKMEMGAPTKTLTSKHGRFEAWIYVLGPKESVILFNKSTMSTISVGVSNTGTIDQGIVDHVEDIH